MDYRYDIERAENAVGWINCLTHTDDKWANQSFNLRDWQADIIRQLFGNVDDAGLRQYKEAFIFLPRKNGKSEIAAAIARLCFLADPPIGKLVVTAAGDRAQARIVFDVAAQMIRNSEWLSGQCTIIDSQSRIVHHPTNSVLMAVSADAKLKHGLKPSVVIYDELHVARTSELFQTLRQGMGAREQRLIISITTAGIDDKNTLVRKKYDHAKRCLDDPKYDPKFLPIIYEVDKEDDIWDEKNWYKANPALGDFRLLDEIREFADTAKKMPSEENYFRRYYLNQWTQQNTRWIQIHQWDKATAKVDAEALAGQACWGGVDLSSTEDITSLELIFPQENNSVKVLSWFWLPRETARIREARDGVPYSAWARQGLITLTDGDYIDTEYIRQTIKSIDNKYSIQNIAIDQFNASDILAKLEGDGINVEKFPYRAYSLTNGGKKIERLVMTEELHHGGNEVLRWMAGNVEIRQNAYGDIMPDKARSSEKIDGIAALNLAFSIWLKDIGDGKDGKPKESYYDSHKLIML